MEKITEKFEVIEKLGEGGFGAVYLARHKDLGIQYAIKVIRSEISQEENFLERFKREAVVLSKLIHKNSIQLREFGTTEEGYFYMAMDYCPGKSLRDLLAEKSPLPPLMVLDMVIQMLDVMAEAHSMGIIHRDIKPENIMVDENNSVKVLDFGIAKLKENLQGETATLTQSGSIIGTPQYMSPEQAGGEDIDHRADLYSLGLVMYEMLSGKIAFKADSVSRVLMLQLTQYPQIFSEVLPPERIPKEMEEVVFKAIQKEKDQRFQGAKEFQDACIALRNNLGSTLAQSAETLSLNQMDQQALANKQVTPEIMVSQVATQVALPAKKPEKSKVSWIVSLCLFGLFVGMGIFLFWKFSPSIAPKGEIDSTITGSGSGSGTADTISPIKNIPPGKENWQISLIPDGLFIKAGLFSLDRSPKARRERGSLSPQMKQAGVSIAEGYGAEEVQNLSGHTAGINTIAWSKDGTIFASGAGDSRIFLWDVKLRKKIATFRERGSVKQVVFSPDGKLLASVHSSKKIILWDVKRQTKLTTLYGHRSAIISVAFSPDGKLLASGSIDKTVKIWNVEERREVRTLTGHTNWVYSLAFSPDGKLLASGGGDKIIKIWDVQNGRPIQTLKDGRRAIRKIVFSPDGKLLASGGGDKTIKIWDVKGGKVVMAFKNYHRVTLALAFSPHGKYLASGGMDHLIRLWDLRAQKLFGVLRGHTRYVQALGFSPRGELLSCGDDRTIRLWDIKQKREIYVFPGHTDTINSVAFSPDGKLLASGSIDSSVRLWDWKKGVLLHTLWGHKWAVKAVAFSPDGTILASGGADRLIRIWDVKTRQIRFLLRAHKRAKIYALAFSPDGKWLVSGDSLGQIYCWDTKTGQQKFILLQDRTYIYSLAFSPDGTYLATGSYNKMIFLWNWKSRQRYWIFQAHQRPVSSVVFSPDGKYLYSSSTDKTVKIWDMAKKTLIQTIPGRSSMGAMALAPNGKLLALRMGLTDIDLWNIITGKKLCVLRGHTYAVTSLSFSKDGKYLASGSRDRTIRIWKIKKISLLDFPSIETSLTFLKSYPSSPTLYFAQSTEGKVYSFALTKKKINFSAGKKHYPSGFRTTLDLRSQHPKAGAELSFKLTIDNSNSQAPLFQFCVVIDCSQESLWDKRLIVFGKIEGGKKVERIFSLPTKTHWAGRSIRMYIKEKWGRGPSLAGLSVLLGKK